MSNYHDMPRMMTDLGKVIRHSFRLLAAAGCKNIQVDEPLFTMSTNRTSTRPSTRST